VPLGDPERQVDRTEGRAGRQEGASGNDPVVWQIPAAVFPDIPGFDRTTDEDPIGGVTSSELLANKNGPDERIGSVDFLSRDARQIEKSSNPEGQPGNLILPN
jgi:hypothetical protein